MENDKKKNEQKDQQEQQSQEDLQDKNMNWEEKAKEYEAGWKRALADLDNYKKQSEKDKFDLVNMMKASSLVRFLEIYDDLERALKFVEDEGLKKGLGEVKDKFKLFFREEGMEEVEFKEGDEFNPELAEAVSSEEHEVGEGKVIETVEVGLKYKDRIIKPAKVRVGK